MTARFPGFGFALCGPLALLLSACGASGALKLGGAAESAPGAPPTAAPAVEAVAMDESALAAGAPAPAPPPAAPSGAPGDAPDLAKARAPALATDAPPANQPGVTAAAPRREMLDIEANVALQVGNVRKTVKALHELSTRVGGVVTAERVDSASQYGTAELTLRVPSGATQGVFEALEKLGTVLNQTVTARDIGKEYFDANLRLSSLEATLHRYEEILAKASKVEELLRIEQEIGRLRQEIEQVKGNIRWLSDRAARATLHLSLREQAPEVVHSELAQPKFFPGLRAPVLIDFGKEKEQGYGGAGISLRGTRVVSLDLDIMKRFDSTSRGPDALLASLGGEIYSELLGDGERSFLNPYLGWRAGYARFDKDNQAMVGATLGVELYKNRWFDLDLEARNYLVFGGSRGAHYGLEPALAAGVAF